MEWSEFSRRTRNDLVRAWAITKKDMRIYYLKPPNLVAGILMPVFLFLAFMVRSNLSAEALIPRLMAMTIFFGASTVPMSVIPFERSQRTFARLLTAPVSIYAVLGGKAIAGVLFGVILSVSALLIGIVGFGMRVGNPLLFIVVVLLSNLAFAAMGILFAAWRGQTPGDVMIMGNTTRLPLMFVSGIFIPLSDLPTWARGIAYLSPLTYCNDLLNTAIRGQGYLGAPIDIGALILFLALFAFFGMRWHESKRREGEYA